MGEDGDDFVEYARRRQQWSQEPDSNIATLWRQETVFRDAAESAQDLLEFELHRRFEALPQDSKDELLSCLERDHEFAIQMCQDIYAEVERRKSDKLVAMIQGYIPSPEQRACGDAKTRENVETYLSELDGKPRSS